MMRARRHSPPGFSLVEMLLAVLVVSIGALAVIGIMADSLNAGEKAVDDSVVALFAEQTLNAIAAQVSQINSWSEGAVRGASVVKAIVAEEMWDEETWNAQDRAKYTEVVVGTVFTNKFIDEVGTGADAFVIEDFAVRCELEVNEHPADANRMQIILRVSSGEFGGPATVTNVYYRELFNHLL